MVIIVADDVVDVDKNVVDVDEDELVDDYGNDHIDDDGDYGDYGDDGDDDDDIATYHNELFS